MLSSEEVVFSSVSLRVEFSHLSKLFTLLGYSLHLLL